MLSSAEALIRWKHPELGMISPGDFIPLFESHGLIHYIDEYVWNEAARQISAWRGKLGFTLPMSVNLSRTDIFDPELEKKLLDIIDGNGLTPDNLKLEVTESAYTDNANQLIAVIDKLRTDGFQIEMDDFGSGYSSLNMLSTLPIDVLKIDMKFIRNIHQGSKEYRLVELILDIARYLNVPVVAEGVETEEQCDMLRNSGCDLVQGYFFSRPLPPQDFEGLIHKEMEQGR
jgi:EAL domain-containing protein (putative c-di-GMP-specific phosphodiesterase class I)